MGVIVLLEVQNSGNVRPRNSENFSLCSPRRESKIRQFVHPTRIFPHITISFESIEKFTEYLGDPYILTETESSLRILKWANPCEVN